MSVLENFMKSNECNHNPQLLHLRPSHQEPAHSVERFISFQIFKEQNDRPCGVAFKSSKSYMNFRTFARDLEDFFGGGKRDRTDDLMLAKHALSQLSYAPIEWWVWMVSNHRPPPYQDGALTN